MDINARPKLIAAGIIALLLLLGAWSLFYTVQPEERAVVKRFGEVKYQVGPGLHWKFPFGIDTVQKVATKRVLKQEFGFRTTGRQGSRSQYSEGDFRAQSQMLAGDLSIVDVSWVVQYRIQDPIKYLYQLRQPERTLRDISESVMRRLVGNRLGSKVLTTGRVDIASQATEEIGEIMKRYDSGLNIKTVELQDVIPPKRVRPAFNAVNEARQERERMINEAKQKRNKRIPRARGAAERTISEAEGYAVERVNRARGEVARFNAILDEYRSAPEVTRRRLFLETINEVAPKADRIFVVQENGQGSPLPLYHLRESAKQGSNAQ
ncbi:FtsH protease activity modulator HflK [Halomonadaceae bacterium KBTZ08]